MKQIRIFSIPEEVAKANDFLAENPPESVVTVSKGEQCFIFVHFDDYTLPDSYKGAEIREYMLSNEKTKINTAVSRVVAKRDLTLYGDKFKKAEEELATLEAEKCPESDKKAKYDWEKNQTEKVTKKKQEVSELANSINNIQAGIEKSFDSDAITDCKNQELQNILDGLTKK